MHKAEIMTGGIVVTLAKDVHGLLGGRFVLGFGVTITTTAAPSYVVEMSPPQVRFLSSRYYLLITPLIVAWPLDWAVSVLVDWFGKMIMLTHTFYRPF
jgi:fucose permease